VVFLCEVGPTHSWDLELDFVEKKFEFLSRYLFTEL